MLDDARLTLTHAPLQCFEMRDHQCFPSIPPHAALLRPHSSHSIQTSPPPARALDAAPSLFDV
jgi:hypothetical protein